MHKNQIGLAGETPKCQRACLLSKAVGLLTVWDMGDGTTGIILHKGKVCAL